MNTSERQRFRQPWLWAVLLASALGVCGMMGWGLVQQFALKRPFGTNPASDTALAWTAGGVVAFELLMLWLMFRLELEVRVEPDALYIRFAPFIRRRIAYSNIRAAEARTYSPIREYGGWGIRYGAAGKAYNVSGNEGVQLRMANGERLLIGSQRANELASAIASHLPLHNDFNG
jgi:hypothetical protein